MIVSKGTKDLYNKIFDGTETKVSNTILVMKETSDLKKCKPIAPIPASYKKEYKKFWGKYGNFNPMWGWYYAARNGIEDVRYVPRSMVYTKVDQHFNARKLGWGFNDKNYYSKIFADISQPETIVRNFGAGIFTDSDYRQINPDEAWKLISSYDEVICKPTQDSGSGRDIAFLKPSQDEKAIKEILSNKSIKDYMFQNIIKQHSGLEIIHPGSINSIRICSLLLEDGVHILSSCLRMGVDDSRVDNVSAGGLSCGISADGTLADYAYNCSIGERTTAHPQGFVFKDQKVPSFDKAIDLVKRAHPTIGHFRLVSWDIAIDEKGEPVLIEANMRKGGVNSHQFCNGPLFGDLTTRVMDEVFGKVDI